MLARVVSEEETRPKQRRSEAGVASTIDAPASPPRRDRTSTSHCIHWRRALREKLERRRGEDGFYWFRWLETREEEREKEIVVVAAKTKKKEEEEEEEKKFLI
ncbi:hypothetical protein JCGZ_03149 [Jatropha curcas]|uniref:Uncharacterized protein n=1 Tax=Jatropha curcas TaxID=180498 RepID=A0A067JGL1_JATCU|nr:hypothetical protein JCGZ_03149 [Jatropha curcas]